MSTWRRKALALFPELRNGASMNDPDYSIYMLYFDLLPMSEKALRTGNDELLQRIYGYAEWCVHHPSKDLWNPAAVAFWEHVFDDWSLSSDVVVWLSPFVFTHVISLYEWRLP